MSGLTAAAIRSRRRTERNSRKGWRVGKIRTGAGGAASGKLTVLGRDLDAMKVEIRTSPARLSSSSEDAVTWSASRDAFAQDGAGLEYFATDTHYHALAEEIVRRLGRRRGFVLVSGIPAPDGALLQRHLDGSPEAGGTQAIDRRATLVRCRPGWGFDDLVRAIGDGISITAADDGGTAWALLSLLMQESRKGLTRIVVIENAEALDDRGFEELLRFSRLDDPHVLPVVLLTEPSFAGRLGLALTFLKTALVARLSLQHLAAAEVLPFIRHQIGAGPSDDVFPPEAIAAIVDAAAGDPAVVNRLARQRLDGLAQSRIPVAHAAGPAAVERVTVERVTGTAAAGPASIEGPVEGPLAADEPLLLDRRADDVPVPVSRRSPAARGRLPLGVIVAWGYVLVLGAAGAALVYVLAQRPTANVIRHVSWAEAVVQRVPETAPFERPAAEAALHPAIDAPTPMRQAALQAPSPAPAESPASLQPDEPSAAPLGTSAAADVAPLIERGARLLAAGDIASARQFFERAAETGDGAAACGLGKSYDPLFLRTAARGIAGDPGKAASWYRRAAETGNAEAATLLARLARNYPAVNSGKR
jgi:hypothetical protein